jgi:hypothetical protein
VHDDHFAAGDPTGHARAPADHGFRVVVVAHRHHDPLARRPVVLDLLLFAVRVQDFFDLVGEPQQRQFAQGGEVAGAEVFAQREFGLLLAVDLAA